MNKWVKSYSAVAHTLVLLAVAVASVWSANPAFRAAVQSFAATLPHWAQALLALAPFLGAIATNFRNLTAAKQ